MPGLVVVARLAVLIVVLLTGLSASLASADDGAHRPCQVTHDLITLGGRLPHATAEIRDHRAIKIVAFGSSSTYGTGASSEAATYPHRLEVELALLFPGIKLDLVNAGVPGDDAADMARRLDHDVIAQSPDLVIWQTGTNDALRKVPVDQFARQTIDGIQHLHDAGIDVVLMEPQYSPKLVEQQGYLEYIAALRTVGHAAGAPVLRRFDIMKSWMSSGQFVNATMLSTDSLHMKDASYACLGWVTAESIAGAVRDGLKAPGRLTAGDPKAR